MNTNQKDSIGFVANNDNKKENPQHQPRSKKNKKMFVYVPEASIETKSDESKKDKENSSKMNPIKTSDSQSKTNNAKSSQVSSQKKNKKQFVYIPEKEENKKVKENIESPKIVEFSPVVIPPMKKQNKEDSKENESKKESEKKNNNSKNNKKKQFVYNPNEEKQKESNNKNNNASKDNQKSNKEFEKDSIKNVKIDLKTSEPLDLVPIIRDSLFKSLDKNNDVIRFIPGKKLQSNPETATTILRILVLLTSKRLGFECNISCDEENSIICKISSHSNVSAIVPHMPNKDEQEDLNRNDTLLKAFGMKSGENLNIDNLSFRAVKSRFPHMPTICIAIICVKRTPKEAVEFAQSFEDSLGSENEINFSQENDVVQSEMKIFKLLAKKYGFEKELFEQLIAEKKKQNNSQIFLDQDENQNDLFKYLSNSFKY